MQKTILSRSLSLLLTLLFSLGTLTGAVAAAWTTSTTAWAETVGGYEVEFATGGTTDTCNGITADVEVMEPDVGWADDGEYGERISFAVSFSGNAEATGRMTVTIDGTKKNGGTFTNSFNVYVKEEKPVENNIDNTLFFHVSMKAMEAYGGLNALKITLDFESRNDIYELYLSSLEHIEINGVLFEFWAGGNAGGGYYAAGEFVGLDLSAWGTALEAGTYTVKISSENPKDLVNFTGTLAVKAGEDIDKDLMEERDVEGQTCFIMPTQNVALKITVSFTPSSGGPGTSKSSSKSSSGGGTGGSSTQSSTPSPAPVNTTAAVQNVKDAVAAAKNSPNGAVVSLKNPTTVSLNTLREMAKAAGNTPLKLNADSLNADGSVDVRITFDPSKANKGLNLSASTTSDEAKKAESKFKNSFDNNLSVVSLSQKGNFGMPVRVAAKVGPKLNTGNLVFYSYDSKTDTYTQITDPQYSVDKNGYVHFTTSFGGDIIITDKPLKKK